MFLTDSIQSKNISIKNYFVDEKKFGVLKYEATEQVGESSKP